LEAALHDMTEGKTVGARFAGFGASERLDVKFLLRAAAASLPLIASDEVGFGRGLLWQAWFWLGLIWAILVMGVAFAAFWRVLRKSLRRRGRDRPDPAR
jgi:hypothetical protein